MFDQPYAYFLVGITDNGREYIAKLKFPGVFVLPWRAKLHVRMGDVLAIHEVVHKRWTDACFFGDVSDDLEDDLEFTRKLAKLHDFWVGVKATRNVDAALEAIEELIRQQIQELVARRDAEQEFMASQQHLLTPSPPDTTDEQDEAQRLRTLLDNL